MSRAILTIDVISDVTMLDASLSSVNFDPIFLIILLWFTKLENNFVYLMNVGLPGEWSISYSY